jgi:hypothetical protein
MQAIAKRLIEANGRDVTLLDSGSTLFDATKPWLGVTDNFNEATATKITAKAVFIDYKEQVIDGELIKRGMKRCLVAFTGLSSQVDVSNFEGIDDGAVVWKIEGVKIVQPGTSVVIYEFMVSQ